MQGIMFTALKRYVKTRLGDESWDQLRSAAGQNGRLFLPAETYPDEDLVALTEAAAELAGVSAQSFVEDYGRFAASELLRVYRGVLSPEWRTLDLIERGEPLSSAGFQATRIGPNRISLRYDHPSKLCSQVKGLVRGQAEHFGETVTIAEDLCMHKGHAFCALTITTQARPVAAPPLSLVATAWARGAAANKPRSS
jgi:hypothetical protein